MPLHQIFLAELHQLLLVWKIATQALVVSGRFVGLTQFAITFAQAKDGGGGNLTLLAELVDGRLVGLNGRVEVVIRLFLQQTFLQRLAQAVVGACQGR